MLLPLLVANARNVVAVAGEMHAAEYCTGARSATEVVVRSVSTLADNDSDVVTHCLVIMSERPMNERHSSGPRDLVALSRNLKNIQYHLYHQ